LGPNEGIAGRIELHGVTYGKWVVNALRLCHAEGRFPIVYIGETFL
jgi:hypothetical protein